MAASGITPDERAKLLGHPIRRRILAHMRQVDRPIAAVELSHALMEHNPKWEVNKISYHVGELKARGFVRCVEEVKVRGAVKHMMVLTDVAKVSDQETVDAIVELIARWGSRDPGQGFREVAAVVGTTGRAVAVVG